MLPLVALITAGLGYPTATAAQTGANKEKGSAGRVAIERRAAIAPDASVRLFGSISSLKVVGWDRDSVLITGTMPTGWRFDGGISRPAVGLGRAGKFFIEGPSDLFPTGAEVEIRLPAGARLWAKSGSADIEVSGVTGGLDLNIVGGSIVVSSRPRELNIESMDGSVRVLGGAAWLRVKTATGDVEVRGGSEDAGLSSVSGAIRVQDGRYERAKVETVTGDITYAGEVGVRGSLDLTTHSGAVEVRVPPRPDLEVDAATVTGTIENTATPARPVPGREGRGMELGFASGSGTTRLVIRSFKGRITVVPR